MLGDQNLDHDLRLKNLRASIIQIFRPFYPETTEGGTLYCGCGYLYPFEKPSGILPKGAM